MAVWQIIGGVERFAAVGLWSVLQADAQRSILTGKMVTDIWFAKGPKN